MSTIIATKTDTGEKLAFQISDSPLGLMLLARSDKGLCAVLFGNDPRELQFDLQRRFPSATLTERSLVGLTDAVNALIANPHQSLEMPLDLRGTPFQQQVWQALRELPSGVTLSYTELAARIGRPEAARAVAQACAANPLAVVVPCHRVLRQDGSLSGYRWGTERKRALLELEARH